MTDAGESYPVDLGPCPACGAPCDCHTGLPDNPLPGGPQSGSIILCAYCGAPGVVTEIGTTRHPTPEERSALALNVRYQIVRGLVLQNLQERP